ncbi:MAG: putative glycolipid-binding domain-containing protein [Myxococcales bacterium]
MFLHADDGGLRIDGATTAVEDGEAWVVQYAIGFGAAWSALSALVAGRSAAGVSQLSVAGDGAGHWELNGAAAPALDGCLDVDLESSALTNAVPVRRLRLAIGRQAEAPAVYVRAGDPHVERLEHRYVRLDDDGDRQRYDYTARRFGFACELLCDSYGLLLDYPGIATRAA